MDVICPECRKSIDFADAFASSFCWAQTHFGQARPAIAFRCPECNTPAHFTPDHEETEIGLLGSGPPLDTIEGSRYPIHLSFHRQGDVLTVQWGAHSKTVPTARSFVAALAARDGL